MRYCVQTYVWKALVMFLSVRLLILLYFIYDNLDDDTAGWTLQALTGLSTWNNAMNVESVWSTDNNSFRLQLSGEKTTDNNLTEAKNPSLASICSKWLVMTTTSQLDNKRIESVINLETSNGWCVVVVVADNSNVTSRSDLKC